MLTGSIIYKHGGRSYKYSIEGYDTSESFSLYMSSANYNAIALMSSAEEVDDIDDIWDRAVCIKLTRVVVQSSRSQDANGKYVRGRVNADLFCRLAALIRYAKVNCTTKNERGNLGLALASSDFEVVVRKTYDIPYPTDESRIYATVVLEYGNIVEMRLNTDDFDIEINSDSDYDRIFYTIKNGWVSGFRLTTEYLGFVVPVQEVFKAAYNDGLYHTLEEVMRAHPEKEFEWLRSRNYKIVTDETLDMICEYIYNWKGFVFYDTETTGLRINFMSRTGQADQCVGIIFSVRDGESFFFPMQMKKVKNLCDGDHWYFMEHYARRILEEKDLVVHNLPFDWRVSFIYDINAHIVHDTLLMLQLTYGAEIEDYKLGLKENTKLILNRDAIELSDMVIDDSWGDNDISFWDLTGELVKYYACADTDDTLGVFEFIMQNDILNKYNASRVYEIELAFAYAIGYSEFYGHRVDVDEIDALGHDVNNEIAKYKKLMVDICGHDFNPNSTTQLRKIMYGELGIPVQVSRKTGSVTTDKNTLNRLAEITDFEGNKKYPFCHYMLEYRKAEAVRKVVDSFPSIMTSDGYIFAKLHQIGTTTGRVTTTSPNYQGYNDPVKKRVRPRPGYYMTDTDYSSIEYRVLANMVGNEHIKEQFVDPDFDYHTYQSAHMFNVPYASVTKTMRKAGKSLNFAIPYGMGDPSIGERVYGDETPENTRKAAGLRKAYFKGQEDIQGWFEMSRDFGVANGFTETYFQRRRYYRRSKFSDSAIRRQAGNQRIQGCLSGECLIITRNEGLVEIKNTGVDVRQKLWIGGSSYTNGTVVFTGRKRKCIITFEGGFQMVCSPDHNFLVLDADGDGVFVKTSELIGGSSKIRVSDSYIPKSRTLYNTGGTDAQSYQDLLERMDNGESRPDYLLGYLDKLYMMDLVGCSFENESDARRLQRVLVMFGFNTAISNNGGSWSLDIIEGMIQDNSLMVEKVEITKDYMDMWDIVNTDAKYYVTGGMIVHNSAADIYKIAVGNVFKRICKEGWLNKVLITGFIHDELLAEVSNDINPGVWLKVLREEFEVKIYGDDGTPWCPLYMGFGYGMSWYEAKSVEIPIKLQWELVEKYGVDGIPDWDGDGYAFCAKIPDMLREFEVRDIRNQILDKDNQGKEIKLALNSQLITCMKEDKNSYNTGIKEYAAEHGYSGEITSDYLKSVENDLCSYLDTKYHIQCLLSDDSGDLVDDFEFVDKTQPMLDLYCKLHGVDRTHVDLLDIAEYEASESTELGGIIYDEDGTGVDNLQLMKDTRIDTLGMYLDVEEKIVYLMLVPAQYMQFIRNHTNKEGKGYRVYFKDTLGLQGGTKGALYSTECYMLSSDVQVIQNMYIKYFNSGGC